MANLDFHYVIRTDFGLYRVGQGICIQGKKTQAVEWDAFAIQLRDLGKAAKKIEHVSASGSVDIDLGSIPDPKGEPILPFQTVKIGIITSRRTARNVITSLLTHTGLPDYITDDHNDVGEKTLLALLDPLLKPMDGRIEIYTPNGTHGSREMYKVHKSD